MHILPVYFSSCLYSVGGGGGEGSGGGGGEHPAPMAGA